MLKRFVALSFLLFAVVFAVSRVTPVRSHFSAAVINNNFPDAHDLPPAGWNGPVFKLSQDYPDTMPAADVRPWEKFDPRTQYLEYLKSVLAYGYEGNIEVDFVVQNNAVRKWYHAPWLHYGDNGREFIHGMTRERHSRPKDLAPTQTSPWQNFAVGFYNAPGGYVMGQVWEDKNAPNPGPALFPNGTVAMKLLFTEAPPSEVPFIDGSYEWLADINRVTETGKKPVTMRLLQIDIAVRDNRVKPTGWVFGTYIYNADAPGKDPLDRMVPVGLMVGNDPQAIAANGPLTESFINPAAKTPHLGYKNRLNGPVDNPVSSCMSCHSTAQVPYPYSLNLPTISGIPPQPPKQTQADLERWFRNIPAGTPFDDRYTSLDYSLQLQVGIANFLKASPPPQTSDSSAPQAAKALKGVKAANIKPMDRDGTPETPESTGPAKKKNTKKKRGK